MLTPTRLRALFLGQEVVLVAGKSVVDEGLALTTLRVEVPPLQPVVAPAHVQGLCAGIV